MILCKWDNSLRPRFANDRLAHMVYTQVKTGHQSAQPQKEEEGEERQQCLRRDLAPVFAVGLSQPGCLAHRNISEIQESGLCGGRG